MVYAVFLVGDVFGDSVVAEGAQGDEVEASWVVTSAAVAEGNHHHAAILAGETTVSPQLLGLNIEERSFLASLPIVQPFALDVVVNCRAIGCLLNVQVGIKVCAVIDSFIVLVTSP